MNVQIPLMKSLPFSQPSIDEDGQYCSDGVDDDDLEIVCKFCGETLFMGKDLNWMDGGYWISPGLTLQKENYDENKEEITCPRCKKKSKLSFFTYMG